MGFFSKIKKKIRKAIPKEAAPFLPALASIFGGPMIASMFGVGGTGMLGQGIGAFLADAGTQELTSDRTRLESSLMSGIFGAARNAPIAKSLTGADGKLLKDEAYKTAFGDLGTKEKIIEGARSFASAPLDEPISMASASTIGVQAAPKLGYNEVERLSKDMAARAAENARQQGLSYEESLAYARSYYYGSNPEASEADFNQFMSYYNSDLENPSLANGGRIGFADGSQEGLMEKLLGNFTGPAIGSLEPRAVSSMEKKLLGNFTGPAIGSQNYSNMIPEDYAGDVYGDRDRDSLNMTEFYKEYPETQVGTYINENRYSSEKIEKLETKLNEIIDMRKRTADRSRNSENDGEISLMEKLLDKEINALYADRTNDDIRKSEAQKRDEMNARFAEENEKKQQMIQDYYNNLGVYARPGRAMGGMINRPNFNYGGGVQPQQQPSATNLAGMGPLAGLGGILGGGMDSNMRMPTTPGYGGGNSNQSGMVGNIMNAVKTGLDGATQDIQSNVSSQFKPQEVLVPANNNGGGNFQPSVTGGTLQELLGTNMGIMGGGPFSQLQSMSNGGRIGYARGTDPYQERYKDKILDPFEGGFEPGDGPDRFPDYEGVNPFNESGGNASTMGGRDMFQKAKIMQIQKMFEAGQISREEAIIQIRNIKSADTVRATMNMGGSMNTPDRPNFNYGSGRQTPQGDPIAPNMPPGMQMDLRPGGFIELGTEPRADDVPAMVGKDEFVLNDRAVAGIGKALTGKADPRAGARALYDLQEQMEATV